MKPFLIPSNFDLNRLHTNQNEPVFDSGNLELWVREKRPTVPDTNGIGVLSEATYCQVKHQLNGEDELVLKYPVTGHLFDDIQLRSVIVANVERTRGNQPYRIYQITKPISGIITVYARHLVYDLAGMVVKPFVAVDIKAALKGMVDNAMTPNPFIFETTRETKAAFSVSVPTSVWSLMGGQRGSLLDVYGGEYEFDGYTVRLENQVGADHGVSVRYSVNMTDLEQDASCADCYTGVVAFWRSEDDVVYSPVVSTVGIYGYTKILPVDMSDRWENKPSVQQLENAASAYIAANQIGVPRVSWKVNFVPLDTTEEYKDIAALEAVSLGDTVGVRFEKLGVDARARVTEIKWDVILERYVSVSLGRVRNNIADTIAGQIQEIAEAPTKEDVEKIANIVAGKLVADFIRAGKISADRIEGGSLALGKELNEAGIIRIFDERNEFIGAIYNGGVWFNRGAFSSSQNPNGFTLRKTVQDVPLYLIYIGKNKPDGTGVDTGFINMYSVDDDGNSTITAFINGKGEISCKRLVVNGHEIT